MLAPVLLWAFGWNVLDRHGENQSWYIVWPMLGFIGLAALWHIALVVAETDRRKAYLAYAAFHAPAFYAIWVIAMIYATHFPL